MRPRRPDSKDNGDDEGEENGSEPSACHCADAHVRSIALFASCSVCNASWLRGGGDDVRPERCNHRSWAAVKANKPRLRAASIMPGSVEALPIQIARIHDSLAMSFTLSGRRSRARLTRARAKVTRAFTGRAQSSPRYVMRAGVTGQNLLRMVADGSIARESAHFC